METVRTTLVIGSGLHRDMRTDTTDSRRTKVRRLEIRTRSKFGEVTQRIIKSPRKAMRRDFLDPTELDIRARTFGLATCRRNLRRKFAGLKVLDLNCPTA